MRFRSQTDPELTLLLHVVASSSPLRWAQKTVKSTIDGTLKSYILICVRWYSLINILSRAYWISPSLSRSLSLFPWFSPQSEPLEVLSYVMAYLCTHCFGKKDRLPMCEIDLPGICAYLVDFLHSSDSSDCTWERTWGRIWKKAQNKDKNMISY